MGASTPAHPSEERLWPEMTSLSLMSILRPADLAVALAADVQRD